MGRGCCLQSGLRDLFPKINDSYYMDNREYARIQALRKYEILDSPPDGSFNKMAELAAQVFNVPIAIISLVDSDRIWFKSHHGLDVEQIGREPGLCASAILADDVYLVEDARNDPRCLTNPLVAGDLGLQFYAAAPLRTKEGFNLGTFCIIDKRQRHLNAGQQAMLKHMASMIVDEIELRLQSRMIIKEYNRRFGEPEKDQSA
jgi:GAF domain-containing protein